MERVLKSSKAFILLSFYLLVTIVHSSAQDVEQAVAKQKPITYSGMADLRGIAYGINGIPARRSPFSYILNANAELNIYQLSIPFSLTLSEQERSFRQPFNQFGMSPKYKWAQAHLGYRNITFSPYTLAGHTMLGAGVELTPGKLRFGFMYGRLNRATSIDTATGIMQPYSFSRKGYAVKLGVGTERKHIELSYLTAADDSNSVERNIPDSLRNVNPAANAVISLRSVYTFAKRLFVEVDGAGSVYTYDISSKLGASEDLDEINSYTKGVVPVNTTTQANLAYTGSIGYRAKNWTVKASYRHIDPEFQSMGAYFFQNDVENYTLGTTFNILKNKLRFSGSIGLQNDNLRKQKTAKTSRTIGNANISWDITNELGLEASYINFSANATPQVVSVNNKYMLAQTTHNISLTPRYIVARDLYTHVIIVSYNNTTLADHNPETSTFNNVKTNIIFLTYNITQNSTGLTVTAGVNHAANQFYTGTVNMIGGTLGISKNFIENKLQTSVNGAYSRTDQFGAASVINLGFNAAYNLTAHHQFSTRYNMTSNTPDNATAANPAFTEHTAELAYTLNF